MLLVWNEGSGNARPERAGIERVLVHFGASATGGAAAPLKRWLGPLAYLYQGAQRLLRFETYRAVFRADGAEVYAGRFAFFAVGDSWRKGGWTRVTPRRATLPIQIQRPGTAEPSRTVAFFPSPEVEDLPRQPRLMSASWIST